MQFKEFLQNLDKKRLALVLGVVVLIIAFVWLLFNLFFISEQITTPEEARREAKEKALSVAESQTQNEEGFVIASIVSKPNQHFQITYNGELDSFNILINTGGRNDETFLTQQETITARDAAEEYFLQEILQTSDLDFACKLNVRVSTFGYGDYFIQPAPLSFCEPN